MRLGERNLFYTTVIYFFPECGRTPSSNPNYIVGPKNDPEINQVGDWPWMASYGILSNNEEWQHHCGTTLISSVYFLTAAHCLGEGYVKI